MNLRSVKILSISSQTRHKCYSNLSIGNVSKLQSMENLESMLIKIFGNIINIQYSVFTIFFRNG